MRLLASLSTVAAIAFVAQLLVALAELDGVAMWLVYVAAMLAAAVAGGVIAPPGPRSTPPRRHEPTRAPSA